MRILVVEDDQTTAQALQLLMSEGNYAVDIATDGEAGLQMVEAFEYDLIVLDVLLPKLDGISVCQQLRAKKLQVPILLLTGQGGARQKAIALNAGADDYVVKPFDAEELMARVQALLRRGTSSQPLLTWGNLSLDPSSRKVSYGMHLLFLTPKEYAILELLLRNSQTVFSAKAILDHAWSAVESPGEEAVRVHIKELRQKLTAVGAPKNLIKTVHRMGYGMNPLYSSTLASDVNQPPTIVQVAELKSVNEELRIVLEQLRSTQAELHQKNQELAIAHHTIAQDREQLQEAREKLERRVAERTAELVQANTLLRENEARLQRLAANVEAMIYQYVLRPNGSDAFIYVSSRCRDIYELEPEEFQQDVGRVWAMIHPEDVSRMKKAILHSAEQLEQFAVEFRLLPASGGLKWVRAVSQPERQPDGEVIWDGLVVDITARKKIETALQESEQRYMTLVEASPAGIFWFDAEGQCTYVNDRWCKMTGRSAETAMGIGWLQAIHPDDRDSTIQSWNQWVQSVKDIPYRYETRFLRPDGTIVWIYCSVLPEIDANGSLVGYIGSLTDLTDAKRREAERKQVEIALQQSEAKFRHFAENSHAVIWIADANAVENNLYASPAYDRIWGRSRQSLIDRPADWIDAVHPDDRDMVKTKLEQQHQGNMSQVEYRIVRPDGTVRWIRDWGFAIRNEAGQVYSYGGIAEDFTERKQIEDALRESEERFRALSTEAPIGVCQSDVDGRCLYVNSHWQEMSGMSLEESLGNGWVQAIYPDDREMLCAAWQAYINQERDDFPIFRIVTPQGEIRWLSARGAALKSATGEITGYVTISEDITERLRTEDERKQAEQKIREQATLLDIAADAIFVRDLDHHILYWNQGAERLYGWKSPEVLGQSARELLQENPSQISEIIQTLLAQGEWQGEIRKITKAGKEVIVSGRWTLVRDEAEQPRFILTVNTDITEKKQLEAQFYRAQRLESLGTLASGIAHDLNNVLTPILTISQVLRLRQSNLDERSQEMLKVLENSAKRGANMVQQILTFTRGTEGKRVPVQVRDLLKEVVTVVQQTFPKSIAIHQDIPASGISLISADPTQLHQVLMNLCVNARDAMPQGGTLTLSVQNCVVDEYFAYMNLDAQVGSYVVITITDTGGGIPAELHDRIFDPFFTTKGVGEGTGLGLSTAMGIVRSHGGFLQVSSDPGQGTQFRVYLPITDSVTPVGESVEIPLQGHGELVLLVDDDVAVQCTNRSLLEAYHYTTLVANDGVEAIALYAQHCNEIKAVLIDVMMPNMDGISAIRALKRINPSIKILALSGLSSNRESVLSAGAEGFLSKPYVLEDLLKTLHNLITDLEA